MQESLLGVQPIPSSWGRWCWVRLAPWCCTRRAETPQTATYDTGSSVCSLACGESEAWHWWQNLYRLAGWGEEERRALQLIYFWHKTSEKVFLHLSTPHFFLSCSPPSSYPPVPGRWWWWEPQRCSQRRRGRQRSTPRKRWTFPSCNLGSGPDSHRWSPLSASTPWKSKREKKKLNQQVFKHFKISLHWAYHNSYTCKVNTLLSQRKY